MTYRLFISNSLNPYHNLAIEERLLHEVGDDELILYLWRNEKTVVIGRNQNIYAEVNLKELEKIGGYPTRRLSGGGAVYHDEGNINFTFVAQTPHFNTERQTEIVLNAIRSLGFDAQKTGRNDLTIDGRKFSGHSFYKTGNRQFHNGTVLINTNPEIMSKVLTPSIEKLQSKGVKSVRSRTVNLAELDPSITWKTVQDALIQSFKDYILSEGNNQQLTVNSQRSTINGQKLEFELESESTVRANNATHRLTDFENRDFIFNKIADFTIEKTLHTDNGNVTLHLLIEKEMIKDVQIFTDSLNTDISAMRNGLLNKKINEIEF